MVEIPEVKFEYDQAGPGWVSCVSSDHKPCKPVIRCNCGVHIGIGLHHVHADGTVTASFFHAAAHELQKDDQGYFFTHKGKRYGTIPGCGWHVFLKLQDYDLGEFPPTD